MSNAKNTSSSSTQVEEMIKQATKATQENMEKMARYSRECMEKSFPNFLQGYEESVSQTKANLDAVARSSALFAKGAEQVLSAVVSMTQAMTEEAICATKAAMGCKNAKELMDLSSDMTKSSFNNFFSQSSKISEMAMKVANEASKPIQSRVQEAVETVSKRAAA